MSNIAKSKQSTGGGERFNTRSDLNKVMEAIRMYVGGDMLLDGIQVPRYGLLSLMARRTPFYVYDHPALEKKWPTAFTDGVHVFFSANFLDQLVDEDEAAMKSGSKEQSALFIALHEMMHMLGLHHQRMRQFDPKTANIAADLSINTRIRNGFPDMKPGKTPHIGWGMQEGDIEKYVHLSEEMIARLYLEEEQQKKEEQEKSNEKGKDGDDNGDGQKGGDPGDDGGEPGDGGGEPGDGGGEPGDGGGEPGDGGGEPGSQKGKGPASKNGKGAPGSPGEKGEGADGGSMTGDGDYDAHIVNIDELYDTLGENGLDYVKDLLELPDTQEGRKTMNDEQKLKLVDDIQKASSQKRSVGDNYPGGHIVDAAAEMIGKLAKPKLKWKAAIREMIIGSGVRYDVSPEEPGDLYYVDGEEMGLMEGENVYLPSMVPCRPNDTILVLVDTSGSVDSEMLREFFSEIFGIVKNEGDQIGEVIVLSADTVVRGEPTIINEDNYEEMLKDVKAYGRGGTDLGESVRIAMDMDTIKDAKLSGLIYFTDLGDYPPKREELPRDLPPMVYLTTPTYMSEEFGRAVSDYADLYDIREGRTVDLERAADRHSSNSPEF